MRFIFGFTILLCSVFAKGKKAPKGKEENPPEDDGGEPQDEE